MKNKLVYFSLGALAAIVIFFVISYARPIIITSYLEKQGLAITPDAMIINLSQASKDLSLQKLAVLLPKSEVTVPYYNSFVQAFNEIVIIDASYSKDLYPLVAQVRNEMDKDGLISTALSQKISDVNSVQKDRLNILSGYLNNLEIANKTLTDQRAAELTAEYIYAGRGLVSNWRIVSGLANKMISGGTHIQTINEASVLKNDYSSAYLSFGRASQKLSSYFNSILLRKTEKK